MFSIVYVPYCSNSITSFLVFDLIGCLSGAVPRLNNPDSKRFSMIGIAVQHFEGARSIVLFYFQKLQAY